MQRLRPQRSAFAPSLTLPTLRRDSLRLSVMSMLDFGPCGSAGRISHVIDAIWTRRPAFDVVLLFAMALFVSSILMFLAEPMIAKMLLPILGGAPMVWTTCVAFFQIMLLAGYAYSWIAARWLPWRLQVLTYVAVLALSLVALPFTLRVGLVPPPATAPVASVLLLLITAIGAPFFALSTTASVLQHWFARTGHAAARDPYFLYIASNVGSLIALLAYPGIVEPTLPLGTGDCLCACVQTAAQSTSHADGRGGT